MRRALVALVGGAILALPASAHAQSRDDVGRADALFNAAKALVDAGQYTDACAKFAESKRLAPGIGVTMYLADCYEHIGRTASAWTEFRSAEGLARERNDKRTELARAHAEGLEPKLLRLTISVAPTVPRAGLQVLRDGVPVAQEELDLPVPIDPGDHAVVVSSPGHAARTFNAHVGPESPTATVRVDSLDETPSPVAPVLPPEVPVAPPPALPPSLPESPAPAQDRGATQRWIGVGVGGAGVAGLVVGSVFGVIAKVKLDQSNNGPCDASTDHCTSPGLGTRKDAERAATTSNILFAIGGGITAIGAALYFTAPRPLSSVTGLTLAPAPVAGGGGALLGGRF
jgi:hypothetical protein